MGAVIDKTKACPKCGNTMFLEDDNDGVYYHCVSCGKCVSLERREVGNMEDKAGTKIQTEKGDTTNNIAENSQNKANHTASTTRNDHKSILLEIPPKPNMTGVSRGMQKELIHEYYEANKENILLDLSLMERKVVCEKWGITQGVMTPLLRRWGYPTRGYKKHTTCGNRQEKKNMNAKSANKDKPVKPHRKRQVIEFVLVGITKEELLVLSDEDFKTTWAALGIFYRIWNKRGEI
jgi:ribosomal protein S27AE